MFSFSHKSRVCCAPFPSLGWIFRSVLRQTPTDIGGNKGWSYQVVSPCHFVNPPTEPLKERLLTEARMWLVVGLHVHHTLSSYSSPWFLNSTVPSFSGCKEAGGPFFSFTSIISFQEDMQVASDPVPSIHHSVVWVMKCFSSLSFDVDQWSLQSQWPLNLNLCTEHPLFSSMVGFLFGCCLLLWKWVRFCSEFVWNHSTFKESLYKILLQY